MTQRRHIVMGNDMIRSEVRQLEGGRYSKIQEFDLLPQPYLHWLGKSSANDRLTIVVREVAYTPRENFVVEQVENSIHGKATSLLFLCLIDVEALRRRKLVNPLGAVDHIDVADDVFFALNRRLMCVRLSHKARTRDRPRSFSMLALWILAPYNVKSDR
jgi:hypothetical protein